MTLRFGVAIGVLALWSSTVSAQDAETTTVAQVDEKAPDFKMTGIDGKEFSLSDVTAEGKNVVLMFSRAHW